MSVTEPDPRKENIALREELKRVRLELRRMEGLKRNLVAVADHELRAPATLLLGYARLLQDATTAEAQEYASSIGACALELKNTIDSMIALQQIDAGELALRLETLSLAEVVQNAVGTRERDINERQTKVEMDNQAGLYIRADRERTALALAQLFSNALKRSPQGGTIAFLTQADSSFIQVSIQDQGAWIPPEEQVRAFEPSYQFNDPFKRQPKGLGLAVAKALVELQGGRIWIESEENCGSTIHLTLPRVFPDDNMEQSAVVPKYAGMVM